ARPWIHGPLGGIREHGVRVREEQQARALSPARDPRDEVRPPGLARVQLAFDSERLQVVAEELGRERLVPGRVDRVQPDPLLEELDRLVAEAHLFAPWIRT